MLSGLSFAMIIKFPEFIDILMQIYTSVSQHANLIYLQILAPVNALFQRDE